MLKRKKPSANKYLYENVISANKTFMKNDETGGRFYFDHWNDEYNESESSQESKEQVSPWRAALFFCTMLMVLMILTYRLWDLQIVQGKENFAFSERNRVHVETLQAPRGVIYSYDGQIVARNQAAFKVVVTPALLDEDPTQTIDALTQTLGVSKDEILQKIQLAGEKNPYEDAVIKSNISRDQQLAIEAKNLKGVQVANDVVRDYPYAEKLAHVLGYPTEITQDELFLPQYSQYGLGDRLGRDGIEQTYQEELKGTAGKKMTEVDALGMPHGVISEKDATPGDILNITIDTKMQEKAYALLEAAMKQYDAIGGAFVVEDVHSGAIRAMVSLPSYNPNLFATGISQNDYDQIIQNKQFPLVNRVTQGEYPPGSTVKMAVGSEALQKGVITKDTRIDDRPGVIRIGEWEFPDWTIAWGRAQFGPMNVIEAIANSSDIFFYTVGGGHNEILGLGESNLAQAYYDYGFDKPTQIDLPTEASGIVPTPEWKEVVKEEPWYLGNTYHMAIGQGDVLVTPLQLNNYVTALANGGTLYKPYLVENILSSEKSPIYAHTPTVLNKVPIDKDYIQTVVEGMRGGTTFGIIYPLKETVVPVAAKTGTAEYGQINDKGEYETHAWLTGFAPYDNPEVSFTIFLERGSKSNNAAEVARDFVNWYFTQNRT